MEMLAPEPQLWAAMNGGLTGMMDTQIFQQALEKTQAIRQQFANISKLPIVQNYRLTEQFDENIQEVRRSNSL